MLLTPILEVYCRADKINSDELPAPAYGCDLMDVASVPSFVSYLCLFTPTLLDNILFAAGQGI